jgi:nucleotide-binding universal stress UspA family protein
MMAWPNRKSVLVPVDFGDASFEALEESLTMVEEPGHVHMIHVVPNLEGEPAFIRNALDGPGRKAAAEEALRKHLGDKGHPDVDVLVRGGAAGEAIAEAAEELGCELIVIPSHGRRGVSRVLLGSVAERVVRLARCSVLVIHGPS